MIVQSIQQLRNRFYSGNRYVQGAQSVQVEVSPGESSVWVIGRSECAFYRIDFSAVEKNKRDAALANRIEILSPFAATGHWTFWDEESANVWLWDSDKQSELAKKNLQASDAIKALPIVPESAFCETHEAGVMLCQAINGYVAQCWNRHQLIDETYWQTKPTQDAWDWFVRGAGQPGQSVPSNNKPLLFNSRPSRSSGQFASEYQRLETTGVSAMLLLFAAVVSYQLVSFGALALASGSLSNELNRDRIVFEETKALREKAYALSETNQRLNALHETRQLALMASVVAALPDNAGLLRKWQFDNDEIKLMLKNPASNLELYATRLSALVGVGSVQLKPQDRSGELEIVLTVGAQ
jgi:hypothetical protein